MAKFFRHRNNVAWLEITWLQLAGYSGNFSPICDRCLKSLAGCNEVTLIPILNEAFCPDCGQAVLEKMKSYPEDKPIEKKREEFWFNYFGIKRDRPAAPGTASAKVFYGQSINRETNCQDGEGSS